MEKKYFESFDKKQIPYLYFKSKIAEKGKKKNVIIFHGMVEPVYRYINFGEYLAENGYNTFVMEIRGHGELRSGEYGDFGKKGIKNVFDDIDIFFKNLINTSQVSRENTVIFGHSMGSLIATELVIRKQFKYLILSGFPLTGKVKARFGYFVTLLERILYFPKKSIFNLQFRKYKKYFTKLDENNDSWLTRDIEEAKKFKEDENCGYSVTPKFYSGIFKMMLFINKNYKKLNENIHILNIYGTEDKVVNVKLLNKIFKKLRKKRRTITIFENENGRHESLNEINKNQIYEEILDWLNKSDL